MLVKYSTTLEEIFSIDQSKHLRTPDLFTDNAQKHIENYACYRADLNDPLGLPTAIITTEDNAETLFADISTFHSNYAPLSAYTHIINPELSNIVTLDINKKPKPLTVSHRSASVLVGMAIGEALTTAHAQKNVSPQTGYANCRKTLSFTLARSKILYPNYDLSKITHSWSRSNEITGNTTPSLLKDSIISITENLEIQTTISKSKAGRKPKETVPALLSYVNGLLSSADYQTALTQAHPTITAFAHNLSGAFDGRINALESIINSMLSENTDKEQAAQCIAFFCNAILPGSLSHIGIVAALMQRYPTILFWYGVFSGSSYEFKWQTINNGLGLKIVRDLTAPFSFERRPDSDIAYEELEVLSRLKLKSTLIKPTHRRSISVSILPGVEIYVDLVTDDNTTRDSRENSTPDRDKNNEQIKALLSTALELLESTRSSDSLERKPAYKRRIT